MALAPLSQTIFLTEDGSLPPAGEKAVTIPPMGIAPSVTLGLLTLSGVLRSGTVSTGTIAGSTEGSYITDIVTGLTINSPARTYTWDGTGGAGTTADGLIETHPNATNTGRTSPVTVVGAVSKITITGTPPTTGQAGTAYSFTPGTANGSGAKVFSKNIALLAGQTFSTSTGAIGGTPTAAGTLVNLIITATDSTGSASTTATTVTIAAASASPTMTNTLGTSTLLASEVGGFPARIDSLDTRLIPFGA